MSEFSEAEAKTMINEMLFALLPGDFTLNEMEHLALDLHTRVCGFVLNRKRAATDKTQEGLF